MEQILRNIGWENIYTEYCKLRNQVRRANRKIQTQHEKNIAKEAKNNPKLFWKYVNSKTKSTSRLPHLYKKDESEPENLTTTDKEKAINKRTC